MAEEQGSRIVGRLVGRQHAGISEPLNCPSHAGAAEGGQPSAPASQPPAASISRPQTNRANERATKRRKRLGSSRHSTTCALPNRVRVHMPGGKVSSARSSGQPALSTRARRSPRIKSSVSRWLTSTMECATSTSAFASAWRSAPPSGSGRSRSHSSGPSHRAATPARCAEVHASCGRARPSASPACSRAISPDRNTRRLAVPFSLSEKEAAVR